MCVPTFNGSATIETALQSALTQTYDDLEVVVVDDASADDTVARVRDISDDRLRVVTNRANRGIAANWNRTVDEARGDFVKFLHQDDVLERDCIESLLLPLLENARVGVVFAPSRITPPASPDDEHWFATYGRLYEAFGDLEMVNSGRAMFDRWVRAGLRENWIGEPTRVMVRRSCLDLVSGFHRFMHQAIDMDLWLRLLFFFDVGFVDRPLSTYTVGAATRVNKALQRDWLDRLWMVEGLLAFDAIRAAYPQLEAVRRRELSIGVRTALSPRRHTRPRATRVVDLTRYLTYRSKRAATKRTDPFGEISPAPHGSCAA